MELKTFDERDFAFLYDFMHPLWHETYGKILPKEQIDFLLNKYFSADGIAHFRAEGYIYYKLTDTELAGVVVICEKDGDTYLDKLYILPEKRGRSYPQFVFSELLKLNRDITLNVNQGNERALACYFKNGFTIEETQLIDLGNGMINKDYKMRLKNTI